MQGSSTGSHQLRKALRSSLPLLGLLAVWEGAARSAWVSSYLLPRPLTVAATGLQLLQEGWLLKHT